ncbi:hypothetical protein [Croceiramulus getboli]|nr:hypothetical protein P8624_04890 [Flavobacteriaceae bacterium YJPT1-3]
MKDKIKAQLVQLALQILKQQDEDESLPALKRQVLELYEQLILLEQLPKENTAKASETLAEPTLSSATAIARKNEEHYERVKFGKSNEAAPATSQSEHDSYRLLHEPAIETIKDMVAQMSPESDEIDQVINAINPDQRFMKNDMEEIGEYGKMPEFEKPEPEETIRPRSLNERVNKGLKIGLNDRLAFVKHLFDGSTADYNRVLSQLSTFTTHEQAVNFIEERVRPDYDWEGKEAYEERFFQLLANTYN